MNQQTKISNFGKVIEKDTLVEERKQTIKKGRQNFSPN